MMAFTNKKLWPKIHASTLLYARLYQDGVETVAYYYTWEIEGSKAKILPLQKKLWNPIEYIGPLEFWCPVLPVRQYPDMNSMWSYPMTDECTGIALSHIDVARAWDGQPKGVSGE